MGDVASVKARACGYPNPSIGLDSRDTGLSENELVAYPEKQDGLMDSNVGPVEALLRQVVTPHGLEVINLFLSARDTPLEFRRLVNVLVDEDSGSSPLSIIEIPHLRAAVGCC